MKRQNLKHLRSTVYFSYEGKCHLCKQYVPVAEMSFDHIVPSSLGGTNKPENLALAHITCNQERGRKPLPNSKEYEVLIYEENDYPLME